MGLSLHCGALSGGSEKPVPQSPSVVQAHDQRFRTLGYQEFQDDPEPEDQPEWAGEKAPPPRAIGAAYRGTAEARLGLSGLGEALAPGLSE